MKKIKEIIKFFIDLSLKNNLISSVLNKILKLFPSFHNVYMRVLCGCTYRLSHQGKFEQSIKMADKICQLTNDSAVLNFISPIYRLQGNLDQSIYLSKQAEKSRQLMSEYLKLDKLNLRVFSRSFTPVGHTGLIDIFMKAQILGLTENKINVIIGNSKNFANPNLMQYWKKYCVIIDDPKTAHALLKVTYPIEELLGIAKFKDGRFVRMEEFATEVQLKWEDFGYEHLLEITQEHADNGYSTLEKLGLPKGSWFCGLHVREGNDQLRAIRNANIETYRSAIEEITDKGGWVIRMGDRSMKPFALPGLNYIDYIFSEYQSDWMDVFIWAKGRFFIGTGSGPAAIPVCFGKPVAYSNWGPLGHRQWGKNDLFLPKVYVNKNTGAIINVKERLSSQCAYHESLIALDSIGVNVIDNSPEEIRDLVLEMIEQIEGKSHYNNDEIVKKKQFSDICLKHSIYPSNLSRAFINRYPSFFIDYE